MNPIKLQVGQVFACNSLRWDDGWEFGHPTLVLSPVLRCFEGHNGHETIMESILIDGVCSGYLRHDDFQETWGWRGYNLHTLCRRFKEALKGKKFPRAGYIAQRTWAEITLDEHGKLSFETYDRYQAKWENK